MNLKRAILLFAAVATLFAMLGFPVQADESNKLTYFTFSGPVELPGIALPPGTYAFKLVDSMGDRNIVQVFDKNMDHLYATLMTIPDYTPQPSDKTIIRFSETRAGAPPAIKEWFYPGDDYGQEFIYPKSRAVELAKAADQPVPSMPSNLASNITDQQNNGNSQSASVKAMENSQIKGEEPNGQEVEVAEVIIAQPPARMPSDVNTVHNVDTEYTQSAKQLPKTATMLPLVLAFGLSLTIFGALVLLALARTA